MDFKPSKVGLTRATLMKGARLDTFIKKYREGEPFFIQGSDQSIVLAFSHSVLESLYHGEIPLVFNDQYGKSIRLSELQKTPEFGGKGRGFGLGAEQTAYNSLKSQLNGLLCDCDSIELKVGNEVYDVSGIENTPGTPKSDFHFIDPYGEPSVWVSHKDGDTPRSFGQWGGISNREMTNVYQNYPHVESEIHNFVNDVREFVGDTMPKACTIARKICNDDLKMSSVYGNQYGNDTGEQNVTVVAQGNVSIKNGEMTSSSGIHENGDPIVSEYEPMLMAMYKGDRNQFGIEGARFSIYPRGGRKIHHEI